MHNVCFSRSPGRFDGCATIAIQVSPFPHNLITSSPEKEKEKYYLFPCFVRLGVGANLEHIISLGNMTRISGRGRRRWGCEDAGTVYMLAGRRIEIARIIIIFSRSCRDMIECEGGGRVNGKDFHQCQAATKALLLTTPIPILLNDISRVSSPNTILHGSIARSQNFAEYNQLIGRLRCRKPRKGYILWNWDSRVVTYKPFWEGFREVMFL
jgi:hypothetical protein